MAYTVPHVKTHTGSHVTSVLRTPDMPDLPACASLLVDSSGYYVVDAVGDYIIIYQNCLLLTTNESLLLETGDLLILEA